MRRRTCLVALAALTLLLWPQPMLSGAGGTPDDLRLTWVESPKTTQTIGWRTEATVTAGKVEYGLPGGRLSTALAAPPRPLLTNIGAIHLFSATLRGLRPGTTYRYRVGDGVNWSPYYSFRTESAAPDVFTFLVFGDSHEKNGPYKVWESTVNEAYRRNPTARFMLTLGDLIYAGRDYREWDTWFAACQNVIARIPTMPALGDHEHRGADGSELYRKPEYATALFNVPRNGPAGFEGQAYSFDYGSVHVAVVNSSFAYQFKDPAEQRAMMDAEAAWLDSDLGATTQPWTIVAYHDATYNLSADRSGTLTKTTFGPIIDKHHVDVVLNAHDHAMARSFFIRNEEFVSSAADGTVYFVSGRAGDNAKDNLGRKVWHPFFYDAQEQSCYLAVEVAAGRLTVITRLQDGTIVDRLVIDRTNPAESTPVVPFGRYQEPRFAAFGYLFQSGAAPVRNAAGEWFVDAHALATYLTGEYNAAERVLTYKEGEIRLQFTDDMFFDDSHGMVSLSGLRSLGFYCRYSPAMNLVMVERWRD
jgi:hypothetical protein